MAATSRGSPAARNIYAYCNIQTQQVIYSLSPTLHNASVRRQLPDTGANTSFVKLRKDLWRPLWTLAIPESEHADVQGRHTFKKLREWRKLHEVSWDPPADLTRPYSEKEIKKLQEALDDRGGSKKENVYDIIRRKKKKMRINTVLDQRANSVADLAAVLIEQDQLGSVTAEQQAAEETKTLEAERSNMLKLAAEAENGGLEKLEARIADLQALKAKSDRLGEVGISRRQLSKQLHDVEMKKTKMETSVKAVAGAKKELAEPGWAERAKLTETMRALADYVQLPDSAKALDVNALKESGLAYTAQRIVEIQTTAAEKINEVISETVFDRRDKQAPGVDTADLMETAKKVQDGALERLEEELKILFSITKDSAKECDGHAPSIDDYTTAGTAQERDLELRHRIRTLQKDKVAMINAVAVYEKSIAASEEIAQIKESLAKCEDKTSSNVIAPTAATWTARLRELLPGFPQTDGSNPNLPKRGRLRTMVKRRNRPVFSTEGIRIKWANQLDAEYAEVWPEGVEHAPMGITRHTAPRADAEPVLDVTSLREEKARIANEWRARAAVRKSADRRLHKVGLDVASKVLTAMGKERTIGYGDSTTTGRVEALA